LRKAEICAKNVIYRGTTPCALPLVVEEENEKREGERERKRESAKKV
jgi:hypothetical protein